MTKPDIFFNLIKSIVRLGYTTVRCRTTVSAGGVQAVGLRFGLSLWTFVIIGNSITSKWHSL